MRQDYYDLIASKIGEGGRTSRIAHRCGWPNGTGLVRRYLLRMEKEGRVCRHQHYTAINDIYWVPAPHPEPAREEGSKP